jgi:hypothetical protein
MKNFKLSKKELIERLEKELSNFYHDKEKTGHIKEFEPNTPMSSYLSKKEMKKFNFAPNANLFEYMSKEEIQAWCDKKIVHFKNNHQIPVNWKITIVPSSVMKTNFFIIPYHKLKITLK